MLQKTGYGIGTKTKLTYEKAIQEVEKLLKEEGFGVLTTIDVKKTLKEKANVDFRKYVILGACHPQLAHQAFQKELEIGLLLPCNVVVYEEGNECVVSVLDPMAMVEMTGNPGLRGIAEEAYKKLTAVLEKMGKK